MAFSSKLLLRFLFSFSLIFLTTPSISNPNRPSLNLNLKDSIPDIHDLLPKYNFPKGLLPANIKSYYLSPQDNTFTIELTHPCYVQFKDQLGFYDTTITGKLGYGKVSEVTGISAKQLFIWIPVTGMDLDEKSNMVVFHAGLFSKSMPVEEFQIIPTCKNKGFEELLLESI